MYQARGTDLDRRRRQAVVAAPIGVERLDGGADVAQRRAGGVGVAAVGDHLHGGCLAGRQPALEIGVDLDHQQHLLIVDQPLHLVGLGQVGDAVEDAGAVQLGQQGRRGRAAVPIEHRVGDVVQVERGGVAEQQALQHRLQQQHVAGARVLQDRQELLADQRQDAAKGGQHRRSAQRLARRAAGQRQHDDGAPPPGWRRWAGSRSTRRRPGTGSAAG